MRNYTFRLKSGQDLFDAIEVICEGKTYRSRVCVERRGQPEHAPLCGWRTGNLYSEYDGHFEIVSITGTVSIHGSHLHISISDEDGKTIGGHLNSGCKIYTTAEIVIAEFDDVVYKREFAEDFGYDELAVYNANNRAARFEHLSSLLLQRDAKNSSWFLTVSLKPKRLPSRVNCGGSTYVVARISSCPKT